MIEEAKAVQRWTGTVEAHERGGFVALGDYMALEQALKRIEQKADVLIAERNQLRAEVERLRGALSEARSEIPCEESYGWEPT